MLSPHPSCVSSTLPIHFLVCRSIGMERVSHCIVRPNVNCRWITDKRSTTSYVKITKWQIIACEIASFVLLFMLVSIQKLFRLVSAQSKKKHTQICQQWKSEKDDMGLTEDLITQCVSTNSFNYWYRQLCYDVGLCVLFVFVCVFYGSSTKQMRFRVFHIVDLEKCRVSEFWL